MELHYSTFTDKPSKPPGSPPKIDDSAQKLLEADLEEWPAATLAQRCSYLLELTGISVGVSTLWQHLGRLGYTHKKSSVEAAERNEFDRAACKVLVADQKEAKRFVFVDEMGSNTLLHPLGAWAPSGQRTSCSVPRNRGKSTTLVARMTIEGMGPALAMEGSTDSEVFEAYIERFLVPSLEAGQVVAMDNLNANKGERVRELIEEAGCELLYLPTYSPDLSPIEPACSLGSGSYHSRRFAKLKATLRRAEARARELLLETLGLALSAVTANDARGYYWHCGYRRAD